MAVSRPEDILANIRERRSSSSGVSRPTAVATPTAGGANTLRLTDLMGTATSGDEGKGIASKILEGALMPLTVLDTPRRGIISGLREIADTMDSDPNTNASWNDFVSQATDPTYGFGTAFADPTGNKWVDRAIGFVGDVALDPLAYLTLGTGAFAGRSGRLALAQVLKKAGYADDVVQKAGRYGLSGFKSAEREALGLSQLLNRDAQSGLRFMGNRIAGTEGISDVVAPRLAKVRSGLAETKVGTNLRNRVVDEQLQPAIEKLLTGRGSMTPGQAAAGISSRRFGDGEASFFLNEISDEIRDTGLKIADDANLRKNGANLLEKGDVSNPLLRTVRDWFDSTLNRMVNDYGLPIATRQRYVPHVWTNEGREILMADDALGVDLRRYLGMTDENIRGSQILEGRQLVGGKTYRLDGREVNFGDGSIDSINAEMRRVFGDRIGDVNVLEDDLVQLIDDYARFAHDAVRQQAYYNELKNIGVAKNTDEVLTEVVDQTASREARRADIEMRRAALGNAVQGETRAQRALERGLDRVTKRWEQRMGSLLGKTGDRMQKVLRANGLEVKDLGARLRNPSTRKQALNRVQVVGQKIADRIKTLDDEIRVLQTKSTGEYNAKLQALMQERSTLDGIVAELDRVSTEMAKFENMPAPQPPKFDDEGRMLLSADEVNVEQAARVAADDPENLAQLERDLTDAIELEDELKGWPKPNDVESYKSRRIRETLGEMDSLEGEIENRLPGIITRDALGAVKLLLNAKKAFKKSAGGEWDEWKAIPKNKRQGWVMRYTKNPDGRGATIDQIQMAGNFDTIEETVNYLVNWFERMDAAKAAYTKAMHGGAKATRAEMEEIGYAAVNGIRVPDYSVDELEQIFNRVDEIQKLGGTDALPDYRVLDGDVPAPKGEVPPELMDEAMTLMGRLDEMMPEGTGDQLPNPSLIRDSLDKRITALASEPSETAAEIATKTAEAAGVRQGRDEFVDLRKQAQDILNTGESVKTGRKTAQTTDERVLWAEGVSILVDPKDAQARINSQQAAFAFGTNHVVAQTAAAAAGFPSAERDLTYRLLGDVYRLESELADATIKVADEKALLELAKRPDSHIVMKKVLMDGWTEISEKLGVAVPDEMTALVRHLPRDNSEMRELFNMWDKYIQFFKTYATLSPRFHIRNAMSATFMNLSDGVSLQSMSEGVDLWRRYSANPKQFMSSATAQEQDMIRAVLATGSGQFDDLGRSVLGSKLTQNKVTNASYKAGQNVEGSVRLAAVVDTFKNGGGFDEAVARVERLHFIYSDQSRWASQYGRRIIPFWTFYSRNLPLQVQQMYLKPRAYQIYRSAMRNLDDTQEGDITPLRLESQGAVKLPFGQDWYLNPDLGFSRLQEEVSKIGNPKRLLADSVPLVKLPIEAIAGRRLYNDQPFRDDRPQALNTPKMALLPLLAALGKTERNDEGQIATTDYTNYALESLIPVLGQSERLLPANDRNKQKQMQNLLSFFLGAPVAKVTDQDKQNELYRRNIGYDWQSGN